MADQTPTTGAGSGHGVRKKTKAQLTVENQARRLQDKRAKLKAGIEKLMAELRLSSDGVYVNVVDTKIILSAQFNLLRKSQRLPGQPNSEEELDPV